ncbi:hypothetical protein RAD15_09120 [Bradyrhizobium sp. 14AA]|uniref:Uncharacterized protein n=1 Tax=Bradyrhizobium xenonodulans TaxID=2736875 RepID=A0ABY7ML15_9BRAD|nr:hypothetical protein [Bradyrhizobium xenonodulans]WBL78072.1 hypothetical protein I3J27_34820 [Bradyrhizobium xenonodulans]
MAMKSLEYGCPDHALPMPKIALLSVDHWMEIATSSTLQFWLEYIASNAMASQ